MYTLKAHQTKAINITLGVQNICSIYNLYVKHRSVANFYTFLYNLTDRSLGRLKDVRFYHVILV